jgi:hypothetical protein
MSWKVFEARLRRLEASGYLARREVLNRPVLAASSRAPPDRGARPAGRGLQRRRSRRGRRRPSRIDIDPGPVRMSDSYPPYRAGILIRRIPASVRASEVAVPRSSNCPGHCLASFRVFGHSRRSHWSAWAQCVGRAFPCARTVRRLPLGVEAATTGRQVSARYGVVVVVRGVRDGMVRGARWSVARTAPAGELVLLGRRCRSGWLTAASPPATAGCPGTALLCTLPDGRLALTADRERFARGVDAWPQHDAGPALPDGRAD